MRQRDARIVREQSKHPGMGVIATRDTVTTATGRRVQEAFS
jgi:hypothetical protein